MRRRKRQSGTALMEFGMVAPLLLLMSFAAVDLARAFHFGVTVASAARAGLHFASRSEGNAADDAGIKSAAVREGQSIDGLEAEVYRFCTCSAGGARVACSTTCTNKVEYVEVEASMPFATIMRVGGLLPSYTIRNKMVMRVE